MRIYIDGIFDLFHYGHIKSFEKCKTINTNLFLIVGVIDDKTASDYKRQPIYNQKHRYVLVENSKYVDKIIKSAPLIITKQFMDDNKIDLIVHGFSNKADENKQDEFFKYPKSVNKFKTISYCSEISTTSIINKINNLII